MKTPTPQIQTHLKQQYGTEPILLVEVEWVPGMPILYSDRKIDDKDYPYPLILKMSGFDTTINLKASSSNTQFNLVLDDTTETIKNIINENDVHKAAARVYLIYPGMYLEDKLFLLAGEIVTPFEWSDTERSLTFTVLTKLTSNNVGFAMEEGDFPNIPEEALGKAWPLVFGQVCHIPAVQVRGPRVGTLKKGTGIHDFTLEPRICQARKLSCKAIESEELKDCLEESGRNGWGERGRNKCREEEKQRKAEARRIEQINLQMVEYGGTGYKAPEPSAEQQCISKRRQEICRLKQTLADQLEYETPTLEVRGGNQFPQGEKVTLYVEGAYYAGTFSGDTFNIVDRRHPAYDSYDHQPCSAILKRGKVAFDLSIADTLMEPMGIYGTYYRFIDFPKYHDIECSQTFETIAPGGGPEASWRTYGMMTSENFFWAPPGTEVRLIDESEYLNIVSLTTGTVDKVSAYKTYADGRKLLTEIPPEFYTIYKTDYGDYTVTEIGLAKDLPLFSEWYDSQIYVSYTSDVGPNVADIIEWLVGEYTDLTVDASSFATVKTLTENYPCNFFLLNRPDVYKLISDIAYQSRCAVFIRNKTVYLTYLPIEPDASLTISEKDILANSFKETRSNTDHIKTVHKITWQEAGARMNKDWKNKRNFILKYNVNKYGSSQKNENYYTLSNYDLVLKSSTFWLIRESNSWREIEFSTPIKYITLDVGDAIYVSVDSFSPNPVKCIVTYAEYMPDKNSMKIKCWTPIRSGETEPYYWAWPSQQSATAKWPIPGDPNKDAGFKHMSPPVGHLLAGGKTSEDQVILTTGDEHPSDLDDTKPTVDCLVSDEMDVEEMPWQERVQKDVASTTAMAMVPPAEAGEDADEDKCGFPQNGRCGYMVKVNYHYCVNNCAPPSGGPKISNEGYFWTRCHTFGSPTAAKNFWYQKQKCAVDVNEEEIEIGTTVVLKGNIYEDVQEGRKETKYLHFICEPLWGGDGTAEAFQSDVEFGTAKLIDCAYMEPGDECGSPGLMNTAAEDCSCWGVWDIGDMEAAPSDPYPGKYNNIIYGGIPKHKNGNSTATNDCVENDTEGGQPGQPNDGDILVDENGNKTTWLAY